MEQDTNVGLHVRCSVSTDGIDDLVANAKRLVESLEEARRLADEIEDGVEFPVRFYVGGKEKDSCTE